ncbi:MAG TPA: hypothetical protein VG759_06260 [Candidatus Angelobacter sp.]|jgi:hypothetical protein|nr:hypothetical protein [Candidatus Angelobacter sp.]
MYLIPNSRRLNLFAYPPIKEAEATMDHSSSSQETLSTRVRRALDDMAAVRHSLTGITEQDSGTPGGQQNVLDIELAAELKSVVDAMRQLLWTYIQALSAKSGRSPQHVMEWYKMELAVEMLRSARVRKIDPAPANLNQPTNLTPEDTWSFDKLYQNALEVSYLHHDKGR